MSNDVGGSAISQSPPSKIDLGAGRVDVVDVVVLAAVVDELFATVVVETDGLVETSSVDEEQETVRRATLRTHVDRRNLAMDDQRRRRREADRPLVTAPSTFGPANASPARTSEHDSSTH